MTAAIILSAILLIGYALIAFARKARAEELKIRKQ